MRVLFLPFRTAPTVNLVINILLTERLKKQFVFFIPRTYLHPSQTGNTAVSLTYYSEWRESVPLCVRLREVPCSCVFSPAHLEESTSIH